MQARQKIPHDSTWHALVDLLPVFTSYVASFIFVAIYWGNHHHLLHTAHRVSTKIIWSNMALLFCLSLIPFTTGWMGENHFDRLPLAFYCTNLLLCAIAFWFLQKSIMIQYTQSTPLIEALKKQEKKGILSLFFYIAAVVCAFYVPLVSGVLIILTSIIWIIPGKGIERALEKE